MSKLEEVKEALKKEAKVAVTVYQTNPIINYAVKFALANNAPHFKDGWERQVALANEFDYDHRKSSS